MQYSENGEVNLFYECHFVFGILAVWQGDLSYLFRNVILTFQLRITKLFKKIECLNSSTEVIG